MYLMLGEAGFKISFKCVIPMQLYKHQSLETDMLAPAWDNWSTSRFVLILA